MGKSGALSCLNEPRDEQKHKPQLVPAGLGEPLFDSRNVFFFAGHGGSSFLDFGGEGIKKQKKPQEPKSPESIRILYIVSLAFLIVFYVMLGDMPSGEDDTSSFALYKIAMVAIVACTYPYVQGENYIKIAAKGGENPHIEKLCKKRALTPHQKKELETYAASVIWDAKYYADSANKATGIEEFIEAYDELMRNTKYLIPLEGKVGMHGETPSFQYRKFKNDYQWHLRDAVERSYQEILSDASGVYRNNKEKIRWACKFFYMDIDKYSDRFDDETKSFCDNAKKILQNKLGSVAAENDDDVSLDDVTAESGDGEMDLRIVDGMEGHTFEFWCADLLRKNGFSDVVVTPGSGDQGVDITAAKDGILYAIQCKCYSSDLGNKPVQEVHAGKTLYGRHVGVVMTNRGFTAGARELANSTGVLLWGRDKLQEMISAANTQ